MTYIFTDQHPPLMKNGSINDIDPASLKGPIIGTSKPEPTITNSDDGHDHYQYRKSYVISRWLQWVLVPPIHHYAGAQTVVITTKEGYDVAEKVAMENSLSVTAGASAFGLSDSVQADLKLTREMTQNWSESKETQLTKTMAAATTSASWVLYDIIQAQVTTQTNHEWKGEDPPDPTWQQAGTVQTTTLHVVVNQYDDQFQDPQGNQAAMLNNLVAI